MPSLTRTVTLQAAGEQRSIRRTSDKSLVKTHRAIKRRRLDDTPRSRVQAYRGASDEENESVTLSEEMSSDDAEDPSTSDISNDEPEEGQGVEKSVADESDLDRHVEVPNDEAATISFGALAKAQERFSKRKGPGDKQHGDREQVYQFRKPSGDDADAEALERKAGKKDTRDFNRRSSKHAPAQLSSKKAVSRKRDVVPIHKPDVRDPRFQAMSGPLNEHKVRENYAFIDSYRDAEIAELKAGLRKAKDPAAKETLRCALLSMESSKRTQQLKEEQQQVLRQHRKEEREKVESGKRPFYLKRGEVKKRALIERFKGMKGRQVDKVIERRRKKQTTKERKGMPEQRRG
ncbi:MAG: hypothetical protein Q9217_002335 [Psora testacea]